jgi:hypothetical protein
MNPLVLIIISLISGWKSPDANSPVGRYHGFVNQAEEAYFGRGDARAALVHYDSAFAAWPGLRYDHLNASFAAMKDFHYRKFDEYICRGREAGLTRNRVRHMLHKEQPLLWKSFKQYMRNTRVGFYGFFRYRTRIILPSYRKSARKMERVFQRSRRVHTYKCVERLFGKGIDRRNVRRLEKITNAYGFPDMLKTGDSYPSKECGYRYSHVLDYAARFPEFQQTLEKLGPVMLESLEKGGLYPRTLPFLIDRYLFFQGAPQLFGTVVVKKQNVDRSWGYFRHDVQSVDLANEYRTKFFLPSLELEIKKSGIGFKAPEPKNNP